MMIDMDLPEYCCRCPMLVVHKGTDFYPTFLCKMKWREIDKEYLCKKRANFCPMDHVKSSVPQKNVDDIMNAINDALEGTEFEAVGYDNTGVWLQVIIDRR